MDKEDKKEIVGMFEHISEKMDSGFKDVNNRFEDLETRMETGFREIRGEMESGFQEVRGDIKGLRTDLSLVEEKTENNTGFSKEIDTLFDEVKKVKEHIGLKESF